ncbi:hypothetical protein FSP39_010087 [Pinctada imbricata]|uniref:Uncharacterized protein n=1 Tax=Pinctada imbricata TaxID=66713 RepID=A0AA88YCQ0_PINIB|nr:hypothetical protein FSP39_010087 [Pinctada imbricata]
MMDEQNLVVEIPVWVCGTQKWVTGLTKRTTCDDVIYALIYNEGLHELDNTDRYTIYERWRDVERPVTGSHKNIKNLARLGSRTVQCTTDNATH